MKNSLKKFFFIIFILIIAVAVCACESKNNGKDDVTTVTDVQETSAVDSASEETTDGTEETTVERFDYFAADVLNEYVEISREDYQSIPVTLDKAYRVDDQAIDDYITALRVNKASAREGYADLTDQPIELGDTIKLYYRGEVDGVAFDGGSYLPDKYDTPAELTIGSQSFIPGFESSLIGVIPNQTSADNMLAINVTFPISYDDQMGKSTGLAGKEAIFYVYIVSTTKYDLPEFNEEFLKSNVGFEGTIAEFRENLKNSMTEYYSSYVESGKATQIWDALRAKAVVKKTPDVEFTYYYNTYMAQIKSEFEYANSYYQSYYGYAMYETLDDFAIYYMNLSEGDDWKARLESDCNDLITENLIYHAIAELEGIEEISDEEYKKELDYMTEYYASSYGYTSEQVEKMMGKYSISESALYNKIMLFLDGHTAVDYK